MDITIIKEINIILMVINLRKKFLMKLLKFKEGNLKNNQKLLLHKVHQGVENLVYVII
jgi:hypothetical protein